MNKTLKDKVYNAVIDLHRSTKKEWIPLKEIYAEVEKNANVVNGGASIRETIEHHTKASSQFKGDEKFISKKIRSGLYKSVVYDNLKIIEDLKQGDTFTMNQIMSIFKVSGQSGIMKTNTLNCIVLTTDKNKKYYQDSDIKDGVIYYTGEGRFGNQTYSNNNKILIEACANNLPIYLFTKKKSNRYIYEGQFRSFLEPYQTEEPDENGNIRWAWKFPLKIVDLSSYNDSKAISQINSIKKNISKTLDRGEAITFKDGPLNIRKYKKSSRIATRIKPVDYVLEEIVKTEQGEINEKLIYDYVIKKLENEGAKKEAKQAKTFFENKNNTEGYDVLSFEKNESGKYVEKYIEVKSTKGNESTPIDITDKEVEFARKHKKDYYIYRVINAGSKEKYVKILKGEDLFEEYKLVSTSFKIYSK